MAIQFPSGFKITSREPIDTRFVLTLEQMRVAHLEMAMPDVYWAVCSDDNKIYIYNKTNVVSAFSGRFRALESAVPVSDTETIEVKVDSSNNTRYIISIAGKEAAPTNAVLRKHIAEDGTVTYSWDVIYDKDEIDKLLEGKVSAKEGYSLISESDLKKIQDLPETFNTVGASEQNGNIKIDGEEVTVYKEPDDVVHDEHYQHTDNNFTDDLKNKLDNIASGADVSPVKAVYVTDNGETSSVVGADKVARINLDGKQSKIDASNPLSLDVTTESDTRKHFTYSEKLKLRDIEEHAEANRVNDVQVKKHAADNFTSAIIDKVVKLDLSDKQDVIDSDAPLDIGVVKDSAEYKRMTAEERTKLANVETEAEKNKVVDIQVNDESIVVDRVAKITYETSLDKDSTKAPSTTAVRQFVNSSIANNAANYVTSTTTGGNFSSVSALITTRAYYYNGQAYWPKKNDYAIVADDENHDHKQARYICTGAVENVSATWAFQYTLGSAFTTGQQNALDSGITSELVEKIKNVPANAERNKIEVIAINDVIQVPDASRKVSFRIPTGALAELDSVSETNLAATIVAKLNQAHSHANIELLNSLVARQLLTEAQIEQINKVAEKQDVLGFTGTYNKNSNKVVTENTLTEEINKTVQTLTGKIDAIKTFSYKIGTTVPEAKAENVGAIWLVPSKYSNGTPIAYNEYIVIEQGEGYHTEFIGNTEIDLSNYFNKSEIQGLLEGKVDKREGYDLVATEEWNTAKQNIAKLSEDLTAVKALAEAGQNTIETIEVTGATATKVDKKVIINIDTSSFITKDVLNAYALREDLKRVAFTGSYDDLANKPSIPEEVTNDTVAGWGFSKLPAVTGNNKLLKIIDGVANWSELTMDRAFTTIYAVGNLPAGTEIKETDTIKDILYKILRGIVLNSIELNTDNVNTKVFVGETFNPSGLVVTGIYDDGTRAVLTNYDINPDIITSETFKITVIVDGKEATFTVYPHAKVNGSLIGCTAKTDTYQEIAVGNSYSIEINADPGYKPVTADNISFTAGMSNYDVASLTDNILTLSNITGPLSYKVIAEAIKYTTVATITNGTAVFNLNEYRYGDTGTCTITPNDIYGYPKQNNIVLVGATLVNYDITTGKITFTVNGDSEVISVTATCDEYGLSSLAIIDTTNVKTNYTVGEALDLSNLKLTATYANGVNKNLIWGDEGLDTVGITQRHVFTDNDLATSQGNFVVQITYATAVNSAATTMQIALEAAKPDIETEVETITVVPEQVSLLKGQTATMTANIAPIDADLQIVDWNTTADEVVELNPVGGNTVEVTALVDNGGAKAVVTAMATDGSNVVGSSTVTIAEDFYAGYVAANRKSTFTKLTSQELIDNAVAYSRDDTVLCDANAKTYTIKQSPAEFKGVMYFLMPTDKFIDFDEGFYDGVLEDASQNFTDSDWVWSATEITDPDDSTQTITVNTHKDVIINNKAYTVYGKFFNAPDTAETLYVRVKVNL